MNIRSKNVQIIGGTTVIAISIFAYAGYAGRHAGEGAKARISVILPNYKDLSQTDQVILFQSALDCNLHKKPIEKVTIQTCLRLGAAEMQKSHPQLQPIARVDALLAQ